MNRHKLIYSHNVEPRRGLAAWGIVLVKLILAVPHMIVVGALQYLAGILAYIGYWVVAFTGTMPQAVHRLLEISFGWSARMWGWVAGITDVYPPFETDPDYPVDFPVSRPIEPSRGWAVAGLLLVPKVVAAIPHLIVMAFLTLGAAVAGWVGYVVTALTGSFPAGIQDFLAGVLQWNLRVAAWLAGLTDDYPPFELDARPS